MQNTGWYCPNCQAYHAPHVDTCPQGAAPITVPAPLRIEPTDPPGPPWNPWPWQPYEGPYCGGASSSNLPNGWQCWNIPVY